MIDLHSHLLPNLDDGARSLTQSLEVLLRFAHDGVSGVVLTPHLTASRIAHGAEEDVERRDRALASLRAAAPTAVTLHGGFEIMLDQPFPPAAAKDRRFSLAGSRYYLVEFPTTIVAEFATATLDRLARMGVTPLVAHPERYSACTPETVSRWRDGGARIQVDATTLFRPTLRGERARRLVEAGLADVLAADNHGDRRSLAVAARYLRDRGAAAAADWLTMENPRAVVEDREMAPVPPVKLRARWVDRLRELLRG